MMLKATIHYKFVEDPDCLQVASLLYGSGTKLRIQILSSCSMWILIFSFLKYGELI